MGTASACSEGHARLGPSGPSGPIGSGTPRRRFWSTTGCRSTTSSAVFALPECFAAFLAAGRFPHLSGLRHEPILDSGYERNGVRVRQSERRGTG